MCVCLNLPLPIQKNQNILISKLQIIEIYKVENTKFKETKKKCIIKKMHLFTVPLNRLTLTHTQFEAEYKQKKKHYFYMRKFQQNYTKTSSKIRNSLSSLYIQTHTHRAWLSFVIFSLWLLSLSRVSLRVYVPPLIPFFLCVKPSSILNCKGCGKLPSHSRAHEWDGRG